MRTRLAVALILSVSFISAQTITEVETYRRGEDALMRGDIPVAQSSFCALGKYKDSEKQCAWLTGEMKGLVSLHNKRFVDGLAAKQAGDLNRAEQLFRGVKHGTFVERAKQELSQLTELRKKREAAGVVDLPVPIDLMDFSRSWRAAFHQGSVEKLLVLESPQFTRVRVGDVLSRQKHHQEVTQRGLLDVWYGELDRKIQPLSATSALVTGRAYRKVNVNGAYPSGIQVTELWTKESGKWQILYVHESTFTTRVIEARND